jgi:hypothetical protein
MQVALQYFPINTKLVTITNTIHNTVQIYALPTQYSVK